VADHGSRAIPEEVTVLLRSFAWRPQGPRAIGVADLDGDPLPLRVVLQAPVTERFEIGSITKGLTGMLLADARDRREVSLETRVAEICPSLADKAIGDVTILELATHTSGLPRMPYDPLAGLRLLPALVLGSNPYRPMSPKELFKIAGDQALASRRSFRYSNLGGALLGQLLAISSGQEYSALLTDRVFAPLGMRETGVSTDTAHALVGRSGRGRKMRPWIMSAFSPAGGVYSTIDDMAQLALSLLRRSAPGFSAIEPLDGIDTDRMGRSIGLFWLIDQLGPHGSRRIWHNGGTGGYSAFLGLYPDIGKAVVVLQAVANRTSELSSIASSAATIPIPRQ
jgi:CubicO group peptidase (beta-lactamase class C family)